jgi:toxin ParE1/3/4
MVEWSVPAKNDLKKIHEYIAQDSTFYAQKVILTLIEKSENLNNFSEMGRIVPELQEKNIRELLIYSYRIIYEIIKSDIIIHAVIHMKRDFNQDLY